MKSRVESLAIALLVVQDTNHCDSRSPNSAYSLTNAYAAFLRKNYLF